MLNCINSFYYQFYRYRIPFLWIVFQISKFNSMITTVFQNIMYIMIIKAKFLTISFIDSKFGIFQFILNSCGTCFLSDSCFCSLYQQFAIRGKVLPLFKIVDSSLTHFEHIVMPAIIYTERIDECIVVCRFMLCHITYY